MTARQSAAQLSGVGEVPAAALGASEAPVFATGGGIAKLGGSVARSVDSRPVNPILRAK